jgi:hypothetical protein
MSALLWSAFGFLMLVLVGGTALLAVSALRAWRTVAQLRRGALAELGRVLDGATAVADKAAHLGEKAVEVQKSVARLTRTIAQARILLAAAQEATALVGSARAFVPKK